MRATGTKTVARRPAFARALLSRFAKDVTGATAIEYAVLIGMMALVCIASFSALGTGSSGKWGNMANAVITAMSTK